MGLGEGFASPRLVPKRSEGRLRTVVCLGRHSRYHPRFITPCKDTNSTPSRSGAPAPGGGVPSERQWVTQRPRRDEEGAPRTLGVAPVARLPQQARAPVPWVAPQLEAHVQPG